MTSRYDSQ